MTRAPVSALRRSPASLVPLLLCSLLPSCQPYRIEYHPRPRFHHYASEEPLPDRVRLPDGTLIVYVESDEQAGMLGAASKRKNGTEPFRIREEKENGDVVLRALLPEHVLVNTLTCVINEEYDLIWQQVLAEQTRRNYEREGLGYNDFEAFFRRNRDKLAETLNRMALGLPRNEVATDNLGNGVIRLRFHPHIGSQFLFRTVTVTSERGGLKLLLIE